jgi:hypothetical protein
MGQLNVALQASPPLARPSASAPSPLKANPGVSLTRIAEIAGVSRHTVASAAAEAGCIALT